MGRENRYQAQPRWWFAPWGERSAPKLGSLAVSPAGRVTTGLRLCWRKVTLRVDAESVFGDASLSEATRQTQADLVMSFFAPGEILETVERVTVP